MLNLSSSARHHGSAFAKRPRSQAGISLLESLVALLVLALGILGLAGLQTRSVTESRLTNARSVAVHMASDIQERMKLNARAQTDSINTGNPSPYVTNWGAPPAATNCITGRCDPAQLAVFDLNQWKTTLAASLPGGDGNIYQSANDPGAYGVVIAWRNNVNAESRGDDADADAYDAPFTIDTGAANVDCPVNNVCHLVRIRP